jgi:pyruvate dehydrogenase (quinone)
LLNRDSLNRSETASEIRPEPPTFAFPDRAVIALVGGGAMLMNGVNELITIADYWKEWSDPRLSIMVLGNRDLNQVTWEQRALAGDPKIKTSQIVPQFGFARYAELVGLLGIEVSKPEDIGPAWEQALSAPRPTVLEVHTDPEVPTIPPHITFEQARHFTTSMFSDPNAPAMARGTFKDAIQSFLPGKKQNN